MEIAPNHLLHTSFSPDAYRVGLKWWLGIPLMADAQGVTVLCPGCGTQVDAHGDHLLCCPRNNFTHRHTAVQDGLVSILNDASQPYSREVVIPNCPLGHLRPADVLLHGWQTGLDTAVDLTVVHAWQLAEQAQAPTPATRERWRTFLTRAERRKKDRYTAPCRAASWTFQPMAFGTWGGMGPDAAKLLARLLPRAAGWLEGSLRTRRQWELRANLGVALMTHIWRVLDAKNFLM
jgi:hypothetical protein